MESFNTDAEYREGEDDIVEGHSEFIKAAQNIEAELRAFDIPETSMYAVLEAMKAQNPNSVVCIAFERGIQSLENTNS